MQRHRHLLVAVDGSEAGFNALSESIRFAHWSRGTVTALVVTPFYEGDLSLVGVKDIKGAILGSLGKIMKRALDLAESQGFHLSTVCEQGELVEKLCEVAYSRGRDLVVLGVSGRFSAVRALMGDSIAKLLAGTAQDVLFLPERAAMGWERILYLARPEDVDTGVSDRTIAIAAAYGGSVNIQDLPGRGFGFRTFRPGTDGGASISLTPGYLEEIRAEAQRAGVNSEVTGRRGADLATARHTADQSGAEIVVTAWPKRRGLRKFWAGVGLERIVYGFSRPVLVLRPSTHAMS